MNEETRKLMLDDYHNNLTLTVSDIAKKYGYSESTINSNVDYHEPKRLMNKHKKYSFSIEAFKKDSIDKYYWLGFISADGGIVKNTLTIDLKVDDYKQLENFNAFCSNNFNLRYHVNSTGHQYCRTRINSKELIEYLAEYNIVNKKSLIFTPPWDKIPEEYRYHYIRGLLDGDGSISYHDTQICLTFCSGNEQCAKEIKDFLGIDNLLHASKGTWSKTVTYQWQVVGNKKAMKILDKIYLDSSPKNRLDRKYQIYLKQSIANQCK